MRYELIQYRNKCKSYFNRLKYKIKKYLSLLFYDFIYWVMSKHKIEYIEMLPNGQQRKVIYKGKEIIYDKIKEK